MIAGSGVAQAEPVNAKPGSEVIDREGDDCHLQFPAMEPALAPTRS
jgi:hypothetical protein